MMHLFHSFQGQRQLLVHYYPTKKAPLPAPLGECIRPNDRQTYRYIYAVSKPTSQPSAALFRMHHCILNAPHMQIYSV